MSWDFPAGALEVYRAKRVKSPVVDFYFIRVQERPRAIISIIRRERHECALSLATRPKLTAGGLPTATSHDFHLQDLRSTWDFSQHY